MSNPLPFEPQDSPMPTRGAWCPVPMSLYVPMMHCFFGDGPRYADLAQPSPQDAPPAAPFIPPDVTLLKPTDQWKPRGYALRQQQARTSPQEATNEGNLSKAVEESPEAHLQRGRGKAPPPQTDGGRQGPLR